MAVKIDHTKKESGLRCSSLVLGTAARLRRVPMLLAIAVTRNGYVEA